jgi:hypothetical protein
LITVALIRRASASASADFPLAVGPAMISARGITDGSVRAVSRTQPLVPPLTTCGMKQHRDRHVGLHA